MEWNWNTRRPPDLVATDNKNHCYDWAKPADIDFPDIQYNIVMALFYSHVDIQAWEMFV